jgi:hypothetical protein
MGCKKKAASRPPLRKSLQIRMGGTEYCANRPMVELIAPALALAV